MSKFNRTTTRNAVGTGPVTVTGTATTYEGALAYSRDPKSELFLLAVTNMVGEDTFYEKAGKRDGRYQVLIAGVAVADPEWMARFLPWLRNTANMRSASLVGALEAARAMVAAGITGSRSIVNSVLVRADEPAEAVAYWISRYGRTIPKPIKRGIADAAVRLYATQWAMLKYDTDSKGVRWGDVLDLTHPSTSLFNQGDLFKYALDRRHGRGADIPESLTMLRYNQALRAEVVTDPSVLLNPEVLRLAGMTWEDALSLVGSKVNKAKLWEAMIPSMGYMALLRNLRNFDEAGVSDEVAATVAAELADPASVARSRQFPFRFLSAYEQLSSLRWGPALERALQASLANTPALPGRTLVLIDTSSSMTTVGFSKRSKVTPGKAAALFGVALFAKGEQGDLVGFADGVFRHPVSKGASVLRETDRFVGRTGVVGHGTQIAASLKATYAGHDRVFIFSDMQTFQSDYWSRGAVTDQVPKTVPIYGFNLGGYAATVIDAGNPNRVELGGLTDATFRLIPLLEAGRSADWDSLF